MNIYRLDNIVPFIHTYAGHDFMSFIAFWPRWSNPSKSHFQNIHYILWTIFQLLRAEWSHMVTYIWVNIAWTNVFWVNIAWINVFLSLSSMKFCGIHIKAITREKLKTFIIDMCSKFVQ